MVATLCSFGQNSCVTSEIFVYGIYRKESHYDHKEVADLL